MESPKPIHILGIVGSLRKGSYNRSALHAAAEMLPDGVTLEIVEVGDLPMFNQDMETADYPAAAAAFKEKIARADAVLFATPEYNYSVPGVLKNAIDWASRPPQTQPFNGKPVAIMGASGGMLATSRAQYHLRQIGVGLNMHFVNRPEVMIARAREKFDADGKLTDQATRDLIKALVEALVDWTRRLSQ